jgi:molybdopterin-guanine dinucleotide biosynthesis protein A
MRLAAVILAGGQGRRIGGGKPLRLLGGIPLIERALVQARRFSDDVAIAFRETGQAATLQARLILDDPDIQGPLAGLVSGLRFAREARADALLAMPADMPFMPDDLAAKLQRALPGNRAAIASSGGHLHPVCGLWLSNCIELVPDYLNSGRRSLKGFAEAAGFATVEWQAEPEDPFFNINTAEDLKAADERLGN